MIAFIIIFDMNVGLAAFAVSAVLIFSILLMKENVSNQFHGAR